MEEYGRRNTTSALLINEACACTSIRLEPLLLSTFEKPTIHRQMKPLFGGNSCDGKTVRDVNVLLKFETFFVQEQL